MPTRWSITFSGLDSGGDVPCSDCGLLNGTHVLEWVPAESLWRWVGPSPTLNMELTCVGTSLSLVVNACGGDATLYVGAVTNCTGSNALAADTFGFTCNDTMPVAATVSPDGPVTGECCGEYATVAMASGSVEVPPAGLPASGTLRYKFVATSTGLFHATLCVASGDLGASMQVFDGNAATCADNLVAAGTAGSVVGSDCNCGDFQMLSLTAGSMYFIRIDNLDAASAATVSVVLEPGGFC